MALKTTLYLTLFTIAWIGHCDANNGRTGRQNQWEKLSIDNAAYVIKVSPEYLMSNSSVWKNDTVISLISLNFDAPKATLNFTIDSVTHTAYRNSHARVPQELWLSINPVSLDSATDVANTANRIAHKTVTTLLLDYGLLELTPDSASVVRDDLAYCHKKATNSLLRCGISIDSINCLTSLTHITRLGLKSGDLLVVSDESYSTIRENVWTHIVVPCFSSLQGTHILLGYRVFFLPSNSSKENPENSMNPANITTRTKRSAGENSFDIDYIIADGVITPSGPPDRRKFNPFNNMEAWLAKPPGFDKNRVGISVFSRDHFLGQNTAALVALLEQFSAILVEIEDIAEGTSLVTQIAQGAKQHPGIVTTIGLVVSISFDDFEQNKRQLDSFLSVVAAGNEVLRGIITSIIFTFAVPLQKDESMSGNKFSGGRVDFDKFLGRTHALNEIVNYVVMEGLTDINIGVIWETEAIDEIIHSEAHVNKYLEYVASNALYGNAILLKLTVSIDALSWQNLLHVTRRIKYKLSSYIEIIRGPPSPTYDPARLGVYIGIDGCTGEPYKNMAEILEFLLFWEIMQYWAASMKVTVFINTAFETHRTEKTGRSCDNRYFLTGQTSCMCGWWQVSNTTKSSSREDLGGVGPVEDKKSIARRLHAEAQGSREKQNNKVALSKKWYEEPLVWMAVGSFLFCAFLGFFSVYMVWRYRSKDLISQREVQRFLLGCKQHATDEAGNDGNSEAHGRGYNMKRYEVAPSSYSIGTLISDVFQNLSVGLVQMRRQMTLTDFESQLGSGEYGTVYKGIIERPEASIDVAVKTINSRRSGTSPRHDNVLAFRGIISEIKILSYVGDHPNIVKLEGAYTAKLRKGTPIVFLELCPMGSLDKHLRTYSPECIDDENPARHLPSELKNNLVKWSLEIVCGMEFLTTKKLVHADLATRNVLLDAVGTAKISDFGLSRRLYNYEEYLKQEQASLPWRWMAPESLRKLIFNEKTDVWAFGVTLWEMYTLGDLPYPGLSYHINFPALLTIPTVIGGVRLGKPKYSSNELYEVMQKCWENFPQDRPSFANLQVLLRSENALCD